MDVSVWQGVYMETLMISGGWDMVKSEEIAKTWV